MHMALAIWNGLQCGMPIPSAQTEERDNFCGLSGFVVELLSISLRYDTARYVRSYRLRPVTQQRQQRCACDRKFPRGPPRPNAVPDSTGTKTKAAGKGAAAAAVLVRARNSASHGHAILLTQVITSCVCAQAPPPFLNLKLLARAQPQPQCRHFCLGLKWSKIVTDMSTAYVSSRPKEGAKESPRPIDDLAIGLSIGLSIAIGQKTPIGLFPIATTKAPGPARPPPLIYNWRGRPRARNPGTPG